MTIFTACTGDNWKPITNIVLPNIEEYCQRHGHTHYNHVSEQRGTLHGFHYSYHKTAAVLDYLRNSGEEILLVLDLDLLITNMTIDVNDFAKSACSIIMTKDINGLNSGSYFVRNDPVGLAWLEMVVALRHCTTSEQHAMWWINEMKYFKERTQVLGHPSINSIPYREYPGFADANITHEEGHWKSGDFLCHLPGMDINQRVKLLHIYKKHVVR